MTSRGGALALAISSVTLIGATHGVQAVDINGVWASDAAQCKNIFVKSSNAVSFSKDADLHGSGFIVEGNQLRGKMGACTVKARKDEDPVVNIVAVCSTDIAISTVQFRFRMIDPNRVLREFPGMPDLQMGYERCSM